MPERIGDPVKASPGTDHGAPVEPTELQCADVQAPNHFGIRGQQDLEAPIEREPVNVVRADSAAHAVGCLEHLAAGACSGQVLRTRETGAAGSDDHDIGTLLHRSSLLTNRCFLAYP